MITENSISENEENKPNSETPHAENAEASQENTLEVEKIINEADQVDFNTVDTSVEEIAVQEPAVDVQENHNESQTSVIDDYKIEKEIPETADQEVLSVPADEKPLEENLAENSETTAPNEDLHEISSNVLPSTLPEILTEMENVLNKADSSSQYRKFNELKDEANRIIHQEKQATNAAGEDGEQPHVEHPLSARLSQIIHLYREKQNNFHKKSEAEQQNNLEHRQSIIDRLKNLYTNTEPGTNLFKSIREIKEQWGNAGQVAKSEFKNLNNNYFHHLNQFYEMLDMNKEYLEQEYAHNLEKRQHIISRAKELENEPLVQKALNELQFLHKKWKEEAEPVAEEFREKTWEEFKEISNKIHDRKSELIGQMEGIQTETLEKKNKIIEEIKKLAAEENPNHSYWQQAIKKVEDLRSEFLKMGNVPKKYSNENWNEFKDNLRNFNTAKNNFYKNLKGSQQTNLEEKFKLIQTAKDNMLSEDWEIIVPLFKKLQEDWKKIGHVPRNLTNKVWDDFREACNTFFNNFREKNNAVTDNWKENFKQKSALLEELKAITDDEGSVEKIEQIKTSWNSIGKVPREKLSINTEFNKTLREKLRLNKINEFDLKEEGLSENQLTDKARKVKNQIADLEAEIVKLENNLSFFGKVTRDNPLLKETFERIDGKKNQLASLKQTLHNIINQD